MFIGKSKQNVEKLSGRMYPLGSQRVIEHTELCKLSNESSVRRQIGPPAEYKASIDVNGIPSWDREISLWLYQLSHEQSIDINAEALQEGLIGSFRVFAADCL